MTDSPRIIEVDYLVGPERLFEQFQKLGVFVTLRRNDHRLVLLNKSRIDFVPLRNERDMDRLQGMEYDMVVIDHHSLFTVRMMNAAKLADRGGLTMAAFMMIVDSKEAA